MNHHPLCPEKTPPETSLGTESTVKQPTSIYYIWFVFQTVQHPSGPSLVGRAAEPPRRKWGLLGAAAASGGSGGSAEDLVWWAEASRRRREVWRVAAHEDKSQERTRNEWRSKGRERIPHKFH